MTFLSKKAFSQVVDSAPLVSIDFIVRNKCNQILLGNRTKEPARGWWFVPGGRVQKNEKIISAFQRLLQNELGSSDVINSKFLGVYQHLYDNSVHDENMTTHYIVLSYEIFIDIDHAKIPIEQHSEYKWFDSDELLADEKVHEHTKWYFQSNKKADDFVATFPTKKDLLNNSYES